ncbi:ribonuclease H-like domain-containing protein [Tanacetum coccineum]
MSSTSKVGLAQCVEIEIKTNEDISYEEEMNRTVFNCTKEDFVDKPLYSRFSKTNNFKGVPHPLTGDYTPQPQQEIDDSLYVYGKKGPQKPETSVSDDKFIENSVTSNEEVLSAPKPKEAELSCKMARKVELKKQRVFNTGNGMAKPVWNNANRVNHANHFVPRPVQLIVVRQNVNSVRPNLILGGANVNSHDHPLKNMEDRGIFDSGCSGTGLYRITLDDFERNAKGDLLPLESEILLKVPRKHNMYSFDMKTPAPAKDYTCLIEKATSDESKLWHRRFNRVFFLATKDETSGILRNFIRQIENQLNHRVKIIRSDNGTEFKNRDMLEFSGNKESNKIIRAARTPQQNGAAERMNRP